MCYVSLRVGFAENRKWKEVKYFKQKIFNTVFMKIIFAIWIKAMGRRKRQAIIVAEIIEKVWGRRWCTAV